MLINVLVLHPCNTFTYVLKVNIHTEFVLCNVQVLLSSNNNNFYCSIDWIFFQISAKKNIKFFLIKEDLIFIIEPNLHYKLYKGDFSKAKRLLIFHSTRSLNQSKFSKLGLQAEFRIKLILCK